ncbi:hypothetical protein GH5_01095 [Leishmania sp. Ghana 2012 LV757]|uniref:hypothetical protein n=1 Tax=Leishmania sp. Ghana 2012 LV757 TaxID=2803181 RepID=UPI001B3CDC5A|nr:hypothetical protein GH5_01095 [Leishmania sp. Ghana 2012 LV757]
MESKSNFHRAWVTSAVFVTAALALMARRRQQKRHPAHHTATNTTHAELEEALKRSLLPVLVRPEDLPLGWGVAPPVFYPPHCAAIPLVLPNETQEAEKAYRGVRTGGAVRSKGGGADGAILPPSAFLLCSYSGCAAGAFRTRQDEEVFLAEVVAHHPVLRTRLAENPGKWSELPESVSQVSAGAESADPASEERGSLRFTRTFSHLLVGDDYVILAGVNGPYIVLGVLTGFAGTWPSSLPARVPSGGEECGKEKTGSATPTTTAEKAAISDAIEAIGLATVNVPLATLGSNSSVLSPRLPGTSFATHQGYYRVVCAREGQELELCVPLEWTVRSRCANVSGAASTGSAVAASKTVPCRGDDAYLKEAFLTLAFTPSSFMSEGHVEIHVSGELFAALAEEPQAAAATLWAASGATDVSNPVAKATLEPMTARLLPMPSHARTNAVTIVYVQPRFGVLFSVHLRSAVVYEPWMTDLPSILYYPLGDAAEDEELPSMTIEYVEELPETWEVLASDNEEFVHNVLFHFTNREAAAVSATLTEIGGMRCAMFHETREGHRCRSYVLPRGATVLVIRWVTLEERWERDLPVLQQTLDTLYIDAAVISQ